MQALNVPHLVLPDGTESHCDLRDRAGLTA